MLDLIAVALGTSPAVSLRAEHPTGRRYAEYLKLVASHFKLPISSDTDVINIEKVGDEFHIEINEGIVRSKHLIWAAGDFQYPTTDRIT